MAPPMNACGLLLLAATWIISTVNAHNCVKTGITFETANNLGGVTKCSGYPKEVSQNAYYCGYIDGRAAERICWDRDLNTETVNGEEIRAYRCTNEDENANLKRLENNGNYHTLSMNGTLGQECYSGDPDCFDNCHADIGTVISAFDTTDTTGDVAACGGHLNPVAIACFDLDECVDGVYHSCTGPAQEDCAHRKCPCAEHATCMNSVGSYNCTCNEGYQPDTEGLLDAYDVLGCVDVDECHPTNPCPLNSLCQNTPGSFVCICDDPYQWEEDKLSTCLPRFCVKPPPAPAQSSLDKPNPIYTGTTGYRCDEGYEPGISTINPFEVVCRDDGQYCHCQNAVCQKVRCGLPVLDANAKHNSIVHGVHLDEIHFKCHPGFGVGGNQHNDKYFITCGLIKTGEWTSANAICEDIDECKMSAPCPRHSDCHNTVGSYFCVCHPGYEGDNCHRVSCGDIPTIKHAHLKHSLTSVIGDFELEVLYECDAGYHVGTERDRNQFVTQFSIKCMQDTWWSPQPLPQCVPISCADPGFIPFAKRDGTSFYYKDKVTYTCDKGFRPSNYRADSTNPHYQTYTITCQASGLWTSRPTCIDINECVEKSQPCGLGDNHVCINTRSSYTCSCGALYHLDHSGQNCVKYSKPEHYENPCDVFKSLHMCNHGTCLFAGSSSYPTCQCDPGFAGAFCDHKIDKHDEEHDDIFTWHFILAVVAAIFSFAVMMMALIIMLWITCKEIPKRRRHHRVTNHHVNHVNHGPALRISNGPTIPGGQIIAFS